MKTMLILIAAIRIIAFSGETVIVHSLEPQAQIFLQCEEVKKVRAGKMFTGQSFAENEESMAVQALKGRRGNVVHVTKRLKRVGSGPTRYQSWGTVYSCPPNIVMQLTTDGR